MTWFVTKYPAVPIIPNDGTLTVGYYSFYLWATKHDHAESFAVQRNIGEIIVGTSGAKGMPYPLASALLRKRRLTPTQRLDVVHNLTFLGYLASRALNTPPHEILGDKGFLHEAVHSLLFGNPPRADVIASVEYFERRIPGYLPPRKR